MPQFPSFGEYREPFVGGGSVFFAAIQNQPDATYWINDKYSKLYHFYKAAQHQMPELLAQINAWRAEYLDGKKLYAFLLNNMGDFAPVQIGAAFFILNRITFSGTSESGGFSKQAFEKRFTESSIQRLSVIDSLLKNVKITNLDFEKIIKANGENVLLFLDPPYYDATASLLYGKNGNMHREFDHRRLANTLRDSPHKWLITYDDSEFIRSLYKDFANIQPWQLQYGMKNIQGRSNPKGNELFIRNY